MKIINLFFIDGYVKNGTRCIPYCQPTCTNGKCVAPNQCECNPGYKGTSCDTSKS